MHGEELEQGYLARAELAAGVPGVVLIHDVWGVGEHACDLADRLALEGFHVLAVDLYRRERLARGGELEISDPGAWMRELSDPQVLADLDEAARVLADRPDTSCPKVGVIGFCMGGMYALLAACSCRGFSAAVPFYGLLSHSHGLLAGDLDPEKKPQAPLDAAASLRCPLLGFFGEQDEFVRLGDVRELERRLAGARAASEIVVVPGAGHAFMNATRPDAYRAEAAKCAWERMVEFLRAQLS